MTQTPLKDAERRVHDWLVARGLETQVRRMTQSTRTAEEAAAAVGCAVGQIVKSLVFCTDQDGRPVLLLVSGANRVDETVAASTVGAALVRPHARVVREVTGYAIGGIPPFAHAQPLATYMDRDLLRYEIVWAAAGTPESVLAMTPAMLQTVTGATLIDVVAL